MKIQKELKDSYYSLEELANNSDDSEIKSAIIEIKSQIEKIIKEKDIKTANELMSVMASMNMKLTEDKHGVNYWIDYIYYYDKEFSSKAWIDIPKARMVVDQGKREAASEPSLERMRNICFQLFRLLPDQKGKSKGDIESLLGV